MEHKQYFSDKSYILPVSVDMWVLAVKRAKKMASLKFGVMLAYVIGVPLWVLAFISNMDNWKSSALFIMMVIYWSGMIWFGFRRKRRLERKEEMELRQQELDLWYNEQRRLKESSKSL